MEYRINTPLSEEDVRKLRVGDTVYLSGIIYTARDEAHMRALDLARDGKDIPVDLAGTVIFHCGPLMRRFDEGWKVIAAGPTTSSRMNGMEAAFIERFGVRGIIGKGGMSSETVKAMEKFGAVYLAMTGGTAALSASAFTEVLGVEWLDLGMPEAIWILKAENLGPLIVGIDSHGNSLYEEVEEGVRNRLAGIKKRLSLIGMD